MRNGYRGGRRDNSRSCAGLFFSFLFFPFQGLRSTMHWTLHCFLDAQLYVLDVLYELWEFTARSVQVAVFNPYQCAMWEKHHQLVRLLLCEAYFVKLSWHVCTSVRAFVQEVWTWRISIDISMQLIASWVWYEMLNGLKFPTTCAQKHLISSERCECFTSQALGSCRTLVPFLCLFGW